MSNMTYCRFENTVADMRDCLDAIYEGALDNLSESERLAAFEMHEIAGELAEELKDVSMESE